MDYGPVSGTMGERKVVEFRITIPKYDNDRRPIKRERLQAYVQDIIQLIGGGTVYPKVIGFFWDSEKMQFDIDENMVVSAVKVFDSEGESATNLGWYKAQLKELSVKFGKEFGQYCLFQLLSFLEDSWCPEADRKDRAEESSRADPKWHTFFSAIE